MPVAGRVSFLFAGGSDEIDGKEVIGGDSDGGSGIVSDAEGATDGDGVGGDKVDEAPVRFPYCSGW